MYYDALQNSHGLPHDPLKALVVPRPIGWISTLSKAGIRNLAPYSYFNLIASNPGLVAFSSHGRKDSQINAEETGEFVCNFAGYDLREAVNQSSAAYGADIDEFERVGVATMPSHGVRPPRVAKALAALECKYIKTVSLPRSTEKDAPEDHPCALVIGLITGIYIDDGMLKDGIVQTANMRPLSRLGYMDYAVTDDVFEMMRPQI